MLCVSALLRKIIRNGKLYPIVAFKDLISKISIIIKDWTIIAESSTFSTKI